MCKNEPVGIFKLGWGIKINGNYGSNLTVIFMKEVCVTTHITTFKPATARKSLNVAYSLERNSHVLDVLCKIRENQSHK